MLDSGFDPCPLFTTLPERALFQAKTLGDYYAKVPFPQITAPLTDPDNFSSFYSESGSAFDTLAVNSFPPSKNGIQIANLPAAFSEAANLLMSHHDQVIAESVDLLPTAYRWNTIFRCYLSSRRDHGRNPHFDRTNFIHCTINIAVSNGGKSSWVIPHLEMYRIIKNSDLAFILDQTFEANPLPPSDPKHWSQVLGFIAGPNMLPDQKQRTYYNTLYEELCTAAIQMPEMTLFRFGGLTLHWQPADISPKRVCLVAETEFMDPAKSSNPAARLG